MRHTDYEASGAVNFSNLPKEEQMENAKRFNVHSAASFASELTHPGYVDVPVTYLLATQDKTIPPPVQERLIQTMKDAGADVTVVKFESDHCWPTSVPRSTAFKVLKAIDPSIQ
jgi:predicted esterase